MICHSLCNAVINIFHAGIVSVSGKRVDKLSVGTLEAFSGIAAAGDELPHDKLRGDPLLTVGAIELCLAAGLAVQQSNIDSLPLIYGQTAPNG